jgi:hypothetical protein
VFLFRNHFNKKNYKGSHELYNDHSYLGTDKIQTYKKSHCDRGLMLGKDKVLWKTNSVHNKHNLYYKRRHTRSCKKSDDIWPSNNIGSRPNFPSLQPCSRGDPTAGFFFKQIIKTTVFIWFPEYLHMRLTRSNALSKHPIW